MPVSALDPHARDAFAVGIDDTPADRVRPRPGLEHAGDPLAHLSPDRRILLEPEVRMLEARDLAFHHGEPEFPQDRGPLGALVPTVVIAAVADERRAAARAGQPLPRAVGREPAAVDVAVRQECEPDVRHRLVAEAEVTAGNRPAREAGEEDRVRVPAVPPDDSPQVRHAVVGRRLLVAPPPDDVLLLDRVDVGHDHPDEVAAGQ